MKKSVSENWVYTVRELDGMLKAARPLIKWLNDHANPHCKIVVTQTGAELLRAEGCRTTFTYFKD